jgi:hypothetical protein
MRLDLLKGHFSPFLGQCLIYNINFMRSSPFPLRSVQVSALPTLMEFMKSSQQMVQAKCSAWTSTNWMHTELEFGESQINSCNTVEILTQYSGVDSSRLTGKRNIY